jgi:hypothetical protein
MLVAKPIGPGRKPTSSRPAAKIASSAESMAAEDYERLLEHAAWNFP